jgi:hypothetical protein
LVEVSFSIVAALALRFTAMPHNKKTDVVEPPEGLYHVGLLVNGLPVWVAPYLVLRRCLEATFAGRLGLDNSISRLTKDQSACGLSSAIGIIELRFLA